MKIIAFLFSVFFVSNLLAQSEVGFSGIYNFQTESLGIGARGIFREKKQIQISPQFSYFLPTNKIHEFTLGASAQYNFLKRKKIQSYTLVHLGYNRWMNYESSDMNDARLNNWNAEIGVGVVFGKKIKPFVEWRYNTRHQEGMLHVGLMFNKNSFKGKKEKCAAYD
jgi:hypothetical protein